MPMMSLDAIVSQLRGEPGVSSPEIVKDEFVRAQVASNLDPSSTRTLIVHPLPEELLLKVLCLGLGSAEGNADLGKALNRMNWQDNAPRVGLDPDGDIFCAAFHACADDTKDEPGGALLLRLVRDVVATANKVSLLTTRLALLQAGVSKSITDRFLKQFDAGSPSASGEEIV